MKTQVQFDNPLLKMGGPGLDWRVQSLSWSLPGGADTARLEAALPTGVEMDWLAWLNNGLVVSTPDGLPMWSGVIEQVRVDHGYGGRVISMADLVNRVKVRWQRTGFSGVEGDPWLETEWLENTKSVTKYGQREMILELGQSSAAQAVAAGMVILDQRTFPTDLPQLNQKPGQPRVILICKGWWHSLEWRIDQESGGRIGHLAGGKSHRSLGAETSSSKLAQSFKVPVGGFYLGQVNFRLALAAAPLDNIVLDVCTNVNDQPGAVLTSAVMPAVELNGSWTWANWQIDPPLDLPAGETYWLVLRRSGGVDPINYYKVESDDGPGYADGVCKRWSGSQWLLVQEDLRFTCLAAASVSELIRDLAFLPQGGFLRHVRINLPQEVQALRWREPGLTQAERLRGWLALVSTPGRPVCALVNFQRALDVFPLPILPQLGLQVNHEGSLSDPNGIDGRVDIPPVGRLLDFQRRRWVVMATEWRPGRGFLITSLQEINATLQD